jgi:hypothetical protein
MSHALWVSDEARMASIARSVFSRALRRPVRVLLIASLLTGAYVAGRALKPPIYEATLYFHLAEGDLSDPRNTPKPPSAIREHISNVALSRHRLEEIMRKYHLSERRLARDRVAATDEFREDVLIDVSRNYFLYERRPGEAPRSAQVTISLSGSDAKLTRAVLHEVADAILEQQVAHRSGGLEEARQYLDAQLELARARTRSLQEEIGRLRIEAARADTRRAIDLRARIAALETQARGAIEQALELERRAAAVAFSSEVEGERLGLNLELFDERLEVSTPPLTPLQLALRAAFAFGIVLLLTVPVVGAFDDRIYAPEDLTAFGLPLFGALPRFPGDDACSYSARTSAGRA